MANVALVQASDESPEVRQLGIDLLVGRGMTGWDRAQRTTGFRDATPSLARNDPDMTKPGKGRCSGTRSSSSASSTTDKHPLSWEG